MTRKPIIILEDSAFFHKGQIIEKYNLTSDGININGKFLQENKFIILNENLSSDDEKKIRDIVRQTLKTLLWNLYTKSSTILP